MTNRDDILEEAALAVEERSLLDMRGILAKRKRVREDAELRMKVREEQRTELAELIRSLKTNRRRDSLSVLADLAEIPEGRPHDLYLTDAWPLAWKGWLNIHCNICCSSNGIPPRIEYRIELSDEGRAALKSDHRPNVDRTERKTDSGLS